MGIAGDGAGVCIPRTEPPQRGQKLAFRGIGAPHLPQNIYKSPLIRTSQTKTKTKTKKKRLKAQSQRFEPNVAFTRFDFAK
jgi:hypothetical protein